MAAKACIGIGVVCIILGAIFIFAGTFGVKYELPNQKTDYLVIDSESSEQFKDWSGGYDEQIPYQMVFYFFNLTNPDAVRQVAAIPDYKSLGPYIYRRYRKSINVSFPDGGNEIEFVDFRDYQFDEAASSGSRYDYVTNLNPVFLSALEQAGSEQQMVGGAAGGYFLNYSTYFTGEFVSLYTSFVLPGYLQSAMNDQISIINETLQNTEDSYNFFLETWANGTTNIPNGGNWDGLLLSKSNNGKPTGISRASAAMLLNSSIPFSLIDQGTLTPWAWDRSLVDSNYTDIITKAFGITFSQLQAIWNWRLDSFGQKFINPDVINKYNLSDISDIGWVQFTVGDGVLGGSESSPVSINDIYPTEEIGYYTSVELFSLDSTPNYLSDWQVVKQLMDNVTGLANMTLFQQFALIASDQTGSHNYTQWGMTSAQGDQLYSYLLISGYFQVVPAFLAEFGPTGGLILNQTIDDWVFNCNYFIINLLLPIPTPCSFLVNHTAFNTGTIYSGKNNITEINQYKEWNGSPVVSGVWANDVPVEGCTELGQFQPNQNKQTVLHTFNDEFVRTMTLNYRSSGAIRSINTNEFVLNYTDTFSVDPLYFQTVPGFANMTIYKQAPIYYSLWDMLYVDEDIRNGVIGLNNSITELDATTIIDVEPITGNTLRVKKRLQANLYTPPNCVWCASSSSFFQNWNLTANTFFPFVKAGEYSEISEKLAANVRVKIEALKYGPRYGMIVGLSIGIFLVLLGGVLIAFGKRKMPHGYEGINDHSR